MNLQQFADQILKPKLIHDIKHGNLDDVLADPICVEIILKDRDLVDALKFRINELNKEISK